VLKVELSLAGTAEVREAAEVAGSEVLSHFAVPPRPKSWLDHCHAESQLPEQRPMRLTEHLLPQ